MKTKSFAILMLAGLLAATMWGQTPVGTNEPSYENTTRVPLAITTPDQVDTPIGTLEFFDGVPIGNTTEMVYDYVDRARAVEVFINLIPAVSVYHLRQGMRDIGLTDSNQILIAEQLGDSKPLVLTWNNTSLYTWGFLDLKKDGPTVVEVPPGVLGVFNDMYFRYLADIGAAGQDKGKGGKYLVLPPGYEGEVPDGYFVVRSKTYGVWNFMRGYVEKGVQEATDRIENNLKVYSLSKKEQPAEDGVHQHVGAWRNTRPFRPMTSASTRASNNLIQEEPIEFLDPETTGLVAVHRHRQGPALQPRRPHAPHPHRGGRHRQRLCPRQHRLSARPGPPGLQGHRQRVGHGLRRQGHLLPEGRRPPLRLPPVDALQRRGRHPGDGADASGRRVGLLHRRSRLGSLGRWTVPRPTGCTCRPTSRSRTTGR